MILLHNELSKKSRNFKEQYGYLFDDIFEYPECVTIFPRISAFPAVMIIRPDYYIDRSLFYNIKKKYPTNYKKLAFKIEDFYTMQENGCTEGITELDEYIAHYSLTPNDYIYLVQVANDPLMNSVYTWWGTQYMSEQTVEWGEDLNESTKSKPIVSLLDGDSLLDLVQGEIEILNDVSSMDEIINKLQEWEDEITLRQQIYNS